MGCGGKGLCRIREDDIHRSSHDNKANHISKTVIGLHAKSAIGARLWGYFDMCTEVCDSLVEQK